MKSSFVEVMGTLQDSDHMVQKLPYWSANCPLGHLKQRKFRLNCFVLDVPVRNLRSSIAVFVPCDHYPAKGPLALQIWPYIYNVASLKMRCNNVFVTGNG